VEEESSTLMEGVDADWCEREIKDKKKTEMEIKTKPWMASSQTS